MMDSKYMEMLLYYSKVKAIRYLIESRQVRVCLGLRIILPQQLIVITVVKYSTNNNNNLLGETIFKEVVKHRNKV